MTLRIPNTAVVGLALACGTLAATATATPSSIQVASVISASFANRGARPPVLDERLSRAAAAVHNPDQALDIRARLRHRGVNEGLVVPVIAHGLRSFGEVRERLARYVEHSIVPQRVTHFGVHEDGDLATIVFVRRVLEEVSWPTAAGGTGKGMFRARTTDPRYRSYALAVGYPDGGVTRLQLRRRGRRLEAAVAFARGDGRYIVEVTAVGPQGLEVLAIEDVHVGVPALLTVPLSRPTSQEPCAVLEARLVDRINRERRRLGLPDLATDPELVVTARHHAEAMKVAGIAAHRLPGGRTARARLRRSGIRTGRFFENVAMAATIEQAHRELWRSPSHRLALIDPLVKRIGIGVARRRTDAGQTLFITQHLAAER